MKNKLTLSLVAILLVLISFNVFAYFNQKPMRRGRMNFRGHRTSFRKEQPHKPQKRFKRRKQSKQRIHKSDERLKQRSFKNQQTNSRYNFNQRGYCY